MHRFGRSAQQKMKDRWGGGFILATILALVGAWYAGTWLNNVWKGDVAGNNTNPPGFVGNNPNGSGVVIAPESFDLHLVQVGAFRSQASAQKLVTQLSTNDENAMVSAKSADGLYKVFGGLYMNAEDANAAKTRLTAMPNVTNPWVVKVSVSSMPEAIPVANMTDSKQAAEVKNGLQTMVSYLYEAARWMESGSADASSVVKKGEDLAKLADAMKKMNNAALAPYVQLATNASNNAKAIEVAAQAPLGSPEYVSAMTGYLALVDEYRAMSNAAPATGN